MAGANALKSLYGSRAREQTVLTPDCIIEGLLKLWPEGIALDPCAGPELPAARNIPATVHYHGPPGLDGLSEPWWGRTFCNPPYKELKKWMIKSYSEQVDHVMLVPVRTHREWFMLDAYDAVAFLKPLKFKGHDNVFPAPLCLMYKQGYQGDVMRFEPAFEHLSTQLIYT